MKPRMLESDRYDFAVETIERLGVAEPTIIDIGAGSSIVRGRLEASETFNGRYLEYDLMPRSPQVQRWNIEEKAPGFEIADVVLLMDVVEHLWNPGIALKNVAHTLKPGGVLIMTVPNPAWSKSRVEYPFRDVIQCFTEEDLEVNHHVFTTWFHIVRRMAAGCGLVVDDYVTLESRLPIPNRRTSLTFPFRLLLWAAARAIELGDPAAKGINYGLCLHKSGAVIQ